MAKKKRIISNIGYNPACELPLYECWGSTFTTKLTISKKGESLFATKNKTPKKGELLFVRDVEYRIVGMSNGNVVKGKRNKYWFVKEKHNPSADPFPVLKSNIDKLTDKEMFKR